MKVLVCGGRDYKDRLHVFAALDRIERERGSIDTVIEGGANGADALAREWAREHAQNVSCAVTYIADWRRHGDSAGPIRNRRMLTEGRPDLVVAFPGGRGTANMVAQAKAAHVEVIEVAP